MMLVVAIALAALPTILSLQTFKPTVERSLSEALNAPVTLRSYRLGWVSGASLDGLVVGQPPGFTSDEPLLTLERARLQIGWTSLLRAALDVSGEISGVHLHVLQRADGAVNLSHLGAGGGSVSGRGDVGQRDGDIAADLERVRANFALRDVAIDVVHEEKGTLETIRRLEATIDKRFGSTDFDLDLEAELAGPDASKPPGKLELAADVDASLQRPIDVQLTSAGFDFARYRPLVDSLLGPTALTSLHGVLDGTVKARVENLDTVFVQGALTVTQPHVAGELLHGMTVQADKWVLHPNLRLALDRPGAPPTADLDGFDVDLGFVHVRGLPASTASAWFGGASAVALEFDLDLQALGRAGGPVPQTLAQSPGKVAGKVALRVPAAGFDAVDPLALVREALRVEASVALPRLDLATVTSVRDIDLRATLVGGKATVALAPGAKVNGGALTFEATADLTQPSIPVQATTGVQGTDLVADAVTAVQYVVPLFAGLSRDADLALGGKATGAMTLAGPAGKPDDIGWLTWLDRWTGQGTLALAEAQLRPAPAFAALVRLADPGSPGTLRLHDVAGGFTLRQGAVETALTKLEVAGKAVGLSGRTRLDGTLDHRLDLSALLRGHSDGEKVLRYLAGTPVEAAIAGSLQAPRLVMPDLEKLLADAVKNAAQEEVRKGAEDLLRRGLEKLLERKK